MIGLKLIPVEKIYHRSIFHCGIHVEVGVSAHWAGVVGRGVGEVEGADVGVGEDVDVGVAACVLTSLGSAVSEE